MGFYHVESSLFLGGGGLNDDFLSNFKKLLPNGEATELQKMDTPKTYFAMSLWKERGTLFTLGGFNGACLD